jgi:mono/diheme cytochrome c family protein
MSGVLAVIGLVLLPVSGLGWQREADGITAAHGAELFKTYCASCHGADGTGNGPLARALRHAPADLTQIAKRNGGMFPTARLQRIVAGRDIESHGDREMPVWGDAFTTTREGRSQKITDARIAGIVLYLQSIQHREGH